MMDDRSRVGAADLLKGVAVVLMIQVHLMEVFARQELLESTAGSISLFLGGPFAAPVFLAVMGYFLAGSQRSLARKLQRSGKIILLGLLLNIGLNMNWLAHHLTGRIAGDPWQFVFGADILFTAGIGIGLTALARRFLPDRTWIFAAAAISFPLLSTVLPETHTGNAVSRYAMAFVYSKESWSYFPIIPWLGYVFAGYAWRTAGREYEGLMQSVSLCRPTTACLVLVAAVIAGLSYSWRITTDLPAYYHHGLPYFLWAVAFLLLWGKVIDVLDSTSGPAGFVSGLKWLGRNVTAAYVIQWLLIGNFGTTFYKSQFPVPLALWFLAVTALTILAVWLWLRAKKFVSERIIHIAKS
jgi:uncharacterized membrane protein